MAILQFYVTICGDISEQSHVYHKTTLIFNLLNRAVADND